ncbi:hypothetical protein DYB25_004354 [Aphanomyces astaci]|uniref:Uncharacterized protein n=1 Tax=Aphanomyces astaci TaxID=112090 RepID=A0A397BE96_APHAT|nr:hypothetical protein DYB25_004354 [Aphanomyces astaci]RHY16216.1 hypothetical protein DYB36_005252 [Aphanomyces astaci]RHY60568.1 hypothetical protein DYB34_005013 [Aphanomyces astaci]
MHKEMMTDTQKVAITEYDEGGFVVNEVVSDTSNDCNGSHPNQILVLGCGKRIPRLLEPELAEYLKFHGIVVEYVDSVQTISS